MATIATLQIGEDGWISKAAIIRNPGKGDLLINTAYSFWEECGALGTIRVWRTPLGFRATQERALTAWMECKTIRTASTEEFCNCSPLIF